MSIDVARILMVNRKPFTDAETTIKEALLSAAKHIHGGETAVQAANQVPLSNNVMASRSILIGKDLKNS